MSTISRPTPTPAAFSGGWQRRWRRIGDNETPERMAVVRLQAGDHFVAVAAPSNSASAEMATAGRTGNTDRGLTRRRSFAASRAVGSVSSTVAESVGVRWSDYDEITEEGVVALDSVELTYEESWLRLPDAQSAPAFAVEPVTGVGLAVRCGEHVAAVHRPDSSTPERWGAVHLQRERGVWRTVVRHGDHGASSELEAAVAAAPASLDLSGWVPVAS